MKYFKILIIISLASGLLLAQESATSSMSIEYGVHDILRVEQAFSGQKHVPFDYYDQVIEPVYTGHTLAKNGDYITAISHFQASLNKDSTYVFAYNGMANAYLRLGDTEKAEHYFKKAMKFGRDYAFPYNNLANLYLLQGKKEEAKPLLMTALKLDPNSALINYNIGNIYLEENNLNTAQSYYKKAIRFDRSLCDARYNLALSYWRQNKESIALSEYEKLVGICPGHEKAVLNLAAYYVQSREIEKALILYRQALVVNPRPKVYLALGHVYHNQKYYPEAVKAYESAVQMDPRDTEAKYFLALSYYEQKMLFSARRLCIEILEQDPGHAKAAALLQKIDA
jgi:pentatricopeptide repeat protein